MEVSDTELRALVRESIARHLGPRPTSPSSQALEARSGAHASHALLPLARGGDGDGMCLIEPVVRCTHCGFCLSFGH